MFYFQVKTILKAKMTDAYYNMFWWLMAIMHEVASKAETNKMGPKNLGTSFFKILFYLFMFLFIYYFSYSACSSGAAIAW